jgi:hypothetical protein
MTPEELLAHPEYNHLIWDLKPSRQGKVAVAKSRGGPINIAYEIHGHGKTHLVVSCSISSLTPVFPVPCTKIRGT